MIYLPEEFKEDFSCHTGRFSIKSPYLKDETGFEAKTRRDETKVKLWGYISESTKDFREFYFKVWFHITLETQIEECLVEFFLVHPEQCDIGDIWKCVDPYILAHYNRERHLNISVNTYNPGEYDLDYYNPSKHYRPNSPIHSLTTQHYIFEVMEVNPDNKHVIARRIR